ncbi:MAG: helix-turn-helix domain-containing protein [Clostridia bacterium]|nr:helix-turn-helix domain-containing protein [Clostridia bacterium]
MVYNKFIEVDENAPMYSKRIALLLNKYHMTQKELSDKCTNVSESTLTAWIKGDKNGKRTEPKIEGLNEVAKVFGVSLDYLVGNSDVASLQTTLRAVCEYTGLSEHAVINLIDKNNNSDIEYVNYLIEYGFVRGFFYELALYICSDNMSIAKSTEQALDMMTGEDEDLKRYIENDDNFTRDLMIRCKNPLSIRTSFQSGIFEKAQILELIERLRMIKEDVLNKKP